MSGAIRMRVGVGAVILVMVVAVPVIVGAAVGLVLGVVAFLVAATLHGLLEIFGTVGVVVVVAHRPSVQHGNCLRGPEAATR